MELYVEDIEEFTYTIEYYKWMSKEDKKLFIDGLKIIKLLKSSPGMAQTPRRVSSLIK